MMIIAIDFDGTCVEFGYPSIGREAPHCVEVLHYLLDAGHKLILYTMRDGDELEEAVQWFKDRHIELYGVNENPTQHKWTTSPKVYADVYIDDMALGVPLTSASEGARKVVDWSDVMDWFEWSK